MQKLIFNANFRVINYIFRFRLKLKVLVDKFPINNITNSMAYGTRRFNATFTRTLH